jgi:hypothetical protein
LYDLEVLAGPIAGDPMIGKRARSATVKIMLRGRDRLYALERYR